MKIVLFLVKFLFAGIIVGKEDKHFKTTYRDFTWLTTAIDNCLNEQTGLMVSGWYYKV